MAGSSPAMTTDDAGRGAPHTPLSPRRRPGAHNHRAIASAAALPGCLRPPWLKICKSPSNPETFQRTTQRQSFVIGLAGFTSSPNPQIGGQRSDARSPQATVENLDGRRGREIAGPYCRRQERGVSGSEPGPASRVNAPPRQDVGLKLSPNDRQEARDLRCLSGPLGMRRAHLG